MLSDYVNDVNGLIKADSTTRASIFDPRINDSVISCYNIMKEYSKRTDKKKGVVNPPLPKQVALKKRGEHATTSFKFGKEIDQDTIDTVIDDLKIKNAVVDTLDDGAVSLEIEK